MNTSLPSIKPHALKHGDTIGVIAPSKWLNADDLHSGTKVLVDAGYNVIHGDSNDAQSTPFAGSPEQRADEIHRFFADDDIDAIFCARGGYSAFKVIEHLDYDLIRQHPKIFMGFSDITHYLHAITANTGLVTFHGPMVITYANGLEPQSFEHMEQVLTGAVAVTDLNRFDGTKILREGDANGPLWGGNLSILISLMGTARQLQTDGTILFFEDVHEPLHKIETMLYQLRDSGMLSGIKGLIIGEITDVPDEPIPFGYGIEEMVESVTEGLDIPIVFGSPFGHGDTILTFPMGVASRLFASEGKASLMFREEVVAH